MNHSTLLLALVFIILATSPLPKKGGGRITTVEERLAKPRRPALRGIGFEDPEFRDSFKGRMIGNLTGYRSNIQLVML